MATVASPLVDRMDQPRGQSGTPLARAIDRWIYVLMAVWFIAITLTGFIPDSLAKVAAVQAGQRPPFPLVLHMHAVLMGSFLLLLLAQTWLVATGRCDLHQRLGLVAMALVPALVLVGFILVPTSYHAVWNGAAVAPPERQEQMRELLLFLDNVMLIQLRIGLLFPLFLFIGLRARRRDAGLHKRMMFLGTAMALPAAIDRIAWLPTTFPQSLVATDLYTLLVVAPMFLWDVTRNRRVHRAYWIWLAVNLPFALAVHALWDSQWWHSVAPKLVGL